MQGEYAPPSGRTGKKKPFNTRKKLRKHKQQQVSKKAMAKAELRRAVAKLQTDRQDQEARDRNDRRWES